MLGQGVYTLTEAARLAGFRPSTVRGWFTREDRRGRSVFTSDFDLEEHLISFLDLIDVKVVGELRRERISMAKIRRFYEDFQKKFSDEHPFAHEQFYVSGSDLLLGLTAGKRETIASTTTGQTIFVSIVKPFLREVSYSKLTRQAQLWRIAPGVVLDPTVNLGAPTIDGTRLRTDTVAEAVGAEGGGRGAVEAVAAWYGVDGQLVKAAADFEKRLGKPA